MASKANWHSPSATATSVIFFLRIARGGLPIPNKENWHSSFSQRPRRDELFFNIFWTFSGVPVGCSSSGKSALYSIDNLVGSLEDWEDLLSPHFYIQKNGWKTAKISVAFVTTEKVPRAIKNSQRNSLWKILLSHLHYISLIQNVNFFSGNFYILHEFAICTKLCAWIWKASCGLYCNLSSNILKANQDFELDIKTFFVCASSKREKAVVVWWCS